MGEKIYKKKKERKVKKLTMDKLLLTVTDKRQIQPLLKEGASQETRQQLSDRIHIWS
jgi:hypothetical protein